MAMVMKMSLENILNVILFDCLCYFAIISTHSTCTKTANYLGTKVHVVGVNKGNEKFTMVCSRSPQKLEFGHFTLSFCRR